MSRSAAARRRAPTPSLSVMVDDQCWRKHPEAVAMIRRAARLVLAEPCSNGALGRKALSATILLSGDEKVRQLNAKFRGRRKANNVLAFSGLAGDLAYLGDVALAYGVIAAEAE